MSPLKQPPSKKKIADVVSIDPDPDPPPNKSASSLPDFLWSSLFTESLSSNAPSSSPSYLEDGTPVVIAPPSVILHASSTWAGHLICRFMGEPPSPAKFFSDLNRIWGKYGDISVRRFTSGAFLVHVPSTSTRRWILQTGLWSSGTVSFVVSEWSVTSTLASPPKLTSATTVLTIRDIPPQLWSHEAVATIAGGVAKLIPGTRASLPFSSLGTATIRAIVPLGSPLSSSVMVKDAHGASVLVSIEYGRLPHLCSICNSYGHQAHRCPLRKSATDPIPPKLNSKSLRNPEPASIPEMNSKPISQDVVIDAGQSSSSITPPIKASESSDLDMELDNVVGEQVIVEAATTDNHPVPASSQAELEVPRQLSTPDPEVKIQDMDLDSMEGEGLVLKSTSVSQTSSTLSPSTLGEIRQQDPDSDRSSSHLEAGKEIECPLPSVLDTNQEKVPLLTSSTDVLIKPGPLDPREPDSALGMSHNPSEGFTESTLNDPILPTNVLTMFDVPLSLRSSQETETELPNVPSSAEDSSVPNQKTSIRNKVWANGKNKIKPGPRNPLRCKQSKYQFKSKGVVEKGHEKANHACVPDDEQVHECLLEIQADKKNTLHYEAIDAYKVLRDFKAEGGIIVNTT